MSQPDWSWRVHNVLDERSEEDRDTQTRLEPIPDGTQEKTVAALRAVAARHIKQAKKVNFTRQILFKVNIGLVSFEKSGQDLHVVHSMYAVADDAKKDKIQDKKLFARHKVALTASDEVERPSLQFKGS